jgi:hypothetical protein
MKQSISLVILLVLLIGFVNCQKKEENNRGRNLLALLALRNTGSLGSGSQELANFFADGTSLTSEDSAEVGGAGATGGARNYSTTVENGTGTVRITSEEFNCRLGGKITFNGEHTVSVQSRTNQYNFNLQLSSGSRTVTYENCKISPALTINNGSITFNQTNTGTTSLESSASATTAGSKVTRTLSNLGASIKGKINITVQSRRGTGTSDITIDQTLSLTNRVREWTISSNGRLGSPSLVSRSGTLKGTIVVGERTYTIDKNLDFNDSSD